MPEQMYKQPTRKNIQRKKMLPIQQQNIRGNNLHKDKMVIKDEKYN